MDPIVPERGERIGGRDASQGAAAKAVKTGNRSGGHGGGRASSGGHRSSGMSRLIIGLLVIATAALGVLLYKQQQALSELTAQFNDLQAKIDTTDESLSQSGAALSVKIRQQGETIEAQQQKLKEHFSEIDKLWAARNKQKKQVESAQAGVASLKKQLVASEKKIATATAQVKSARTAALSAQAGSDELASQIDTVLKQLNQFESSIKQWQVRTNGRVQDNEEAIKAIDAFRRSVNRQLLELRNSSAAPQQQ